MKSAILAVAAALMAAPAFGAYYIAGDFQGWDPAATPMTDNGNGTFSIALSGLGTGGRHEFKITQGDWNTAYPPANSWVYADANGNSTITFVPSPAADGWSPTSNRIGESSDPASFNVAGDLNSWNNADPASTMSSLGNGQYQLNVVVPTPATYNAKFVVTGTWDSISWDARSVNTANWSYTTTDPNQTVQFLLDNRAGAAQINVLPVPEPASLGLLALAGSALALRRRRA